MNAVTAQAVADHADEQNTAAFAFVQSLAAELSARGPERAREFTWDRCARLHLELYRAAAR